MIRRLFRINRRKTKTDPAFERGTEAFAQRQRAAFEVIEACNEIVGADDAIELIVVDDGSLVPANDDEAGR